MKPIIIIGKGPSSFPVTKSDKYDIATLNNAIWISPEPTYAFFNDVELFALCKKDDFINVKKIICPSYLHSKWAMLEGLCPDEVTHYQKLYDLFPNWLNHIEITPYELHSGDNTKIEEQIRTNKQIAEVPSLDEWPRSTGVTAANWLSKFANYREFIIMGCDPAGGYNPLFIGAGHVNGVSGFNGQRTAAQPEGYDLDYNQMVRLIERYGGTATHIDHLSTERRIELGI